MQQMPPFYSDHANTVAIMNACETALGGISFEFTEGSSVFYQTTPMQLKRVTKGGLKDYTDSIPLAIVRLAQGEVEHHAFGGKIRNAPLLRMRFAVDMTDALAAEINIANIYDSFTQYFLQHATIGGADNVFNSRLVNNSINFGYTRVQGIDFRVLEMDLHVWQEYALPGGIQP